MKSTTLGRWDAEYTFSDTRRHGQAHVRLDEAPIQSFVAGKTALSIPCRLDSTFANRKVQNLFAYVNIYVIAVSFTKLSIVMFYKRVFQMPKLAWCLVAIVLMYPVR